MRLFVCFVCSSLIGLIISAASGKPSRGPPKAAPSSPKPVPSGAMLSPLAGGSGCGESQGHSGGLGIWSPPGSRLGAFPAPCGGFRRADSASASSPLACGRLGCGCHRVACPSPAMAFLERRLLCMCPCLSPGRPQASVQGCTARAGGLLGPSGFPDGHHAAWPASPKLAAGDLE